MYEDVIRSLLSGVYIVTVEKEGSVNGMTAVWGTQVSYEPQLIGLAVSPVRRSHDMILLSGKFTINVLCEGQEDVARHFGFKTGHMVDKFEGIEYTRGSNGCPIIADIHSYLACKLVTTHKMGDHTFMIGEVQEAKVFKKDANKLVFRPEDYF